MENSAYMPTSLASPALMVLASTAEASRDALHVQGTPAFPGQTTNMDAKDLHIPFSFSMRSLYGQPDNFANLPGHSLHLHNPFLTPAMERGLSFINPTGGGAFRPVATTTSDDRNGFHSAFLPTTAKSSKLDQVVTSSYSHMTGDATFGSAIARGASPLCVKEESSDKETTSSLELQDRLSETPASDLTDGTERSTPDECRSMRRRCNYFSEGEKEKNN
uniref:Uncharacterized protein n=1 Tax=Strigamia maritima TaxID=126957 RepID=T1J1M6_STRMM